MKPTHAIETLVVRGLLGAARARSWQGSLGLGASLGSGLLALGVRRRVAASNLAIAFPELSAEQREALLREHYRELGRVFVEYARLADLALQPIGAVIAEVRGLEHLEHARERGRGAILLSGHFGSFELMGAHVSRLHRIAFVAKPLTNPGVESLLASQRTRAGMAQIDVGSGGRRIYEALHAGQCVAMLADQDARKHGTFVPFMGRLSSTSVGPARIALATGAPVIMGFIHRRPDQRHEIEFEPPLVIEDPRAPDAVLRLTALHAARLERWVRRFPASWFWLHRRWKTPPPRES